MDIFEKVQQIIAETINCGVEEVTLQASLTDDLGADSLDAVELNLALEDAFGIAIPDEDLEQMKTVGSIVDYLEARV